MATLLKPSPPSDAEEGRSDGALEYYAKHTAQVEVKGIPYCESLFNDVLSPPRKRLFCSFGMPELRPESKYGYISLLLLHFPTKFISIMK